jgi:hypothetical protein
MKSIRIDVMRRAKLTMSNEVQVATRRCETRREQTAGLRCRNRLAMEPWSGGSSLSISQASGRSKETRTSASATKTCSRPFTPCTSSRADSSELKIGPPLCVTSRPRALTKRGRHRRLGLGGC